MQPSSDRALSDRELALVSWTFAFRDGDRVDHLIASCGFRSLPSRGWTNAVPRSAYQTYARARGGGLTLLRSVGYPRGLAPWRLVADDGLASRHLELCPAPKVEDDDQPISGAAVFATAATGIVLLVAVVWLLSRVW
jgi:hypothetical protein